ncbi:MAG: PDZ domain-containing protein [Myxococcales bacterium]|nr:PDZ domain-containing protein [Myxococcales bacterium]
MRRRRLPSALVVTWLWGAALACSGDAPTPGGDSPAVAEEAKADLEALLKDREFPLLVWSAFSVQEEYFDKDRFDPRGQLRWALHDLSLHTPELFAELIDDQKIRVTVGGESEDLEIGEIPTLIDASRVLEKVLIFARDHLDLEDEEALHRLEYAAINGFLAPLDPHTILLTPEERSDLGIRTKGQFGGIGAEIVVEERRIRVMRVLPKSPAEAAGLQGGDLIIQIGKESTVNMSAADAQTLLRGPVDTEVELKVRRGDKLLTITITRQIIHVESVLSARLPGDVAYLRITTFQENTGEQAAAAIKAMQGEAPLKGLVFDLRGNTGGLLTQAIAVLDLLISEGELVIVRSAIGRESEAAKPEVLLGPEVGVVAMVDEEAASASEIVSGTLRSLGRGVVVGRRSFGKGTVQMLKPLAPYGRELALKLTVAEYQVAGDQRIQTVGVEPDLVLYPVELTEIPGIARYYDLERFERERERSQVAHLPSARHDPAIAEAPVDKAILRYLLEARALAEGESDYLSDPEVEIARELALASAGASDGAGRRKAVEGARGELAAREDAKIVARLGATRINWEGAPLAGGAPKLAASVEIAEKGPIDAGTPFTLKVKVDNQGDAPAERLHLITECVHDELDGIELLLGTIPAGGSLSRELSLQVMPWHPRFAEDLKVQIHSGEPDPTPDAEAGVRLEIAGRPRSALAYDYWIVDDPALVAKAPQRPEEAGPAVGEPFTVAGNGDGVLQPGERVLLAVRARNTGEAAAATVRALLRNKSGAQGLLEEGFAELGKIGAGAESRGAFGVEVNASPDLQKPLELDLMVADIHLREAARQRLKLRIVDERPAFEAAPGRFRIKDEGARLYNGADGKAEVLGELAGGAVIATVGRAGGWLALELEPGRRAWVPADLAEEAGKGDKASAPPARPALLIAPPALTIDPLPTVVREASVTVTASARHPRRVRDVVVAVAPVGPAQVEDKVSYQANPAREGEAAGAMSIAAAVPLQPGGNRITVTARDGDGVEATREVLVYRE